jgi:hypothetical protein
VPRRLKRPSPPPPRRARAAPRLRARGSPRPALADDRVHAAAEADVGEQLDEVDAAARRAVDEVLALAAAVEPARDRELRVVDRPAPSALSKSSSTSQMSPALRPRRRRRARRRASPPAARRGQRARPPRRSRRRRSTSRAVRADDHGDARLEPDLDRFGNDLKPRSLIARRCTPREASGRRGCRGVRSVGSDGHCFHIVDHAGREWAAVIRKVGGLPEVGSVAEPVGETIEVLAAPINPMTSPCRVCVLASGHPELPYVPGCEAVGRRQTARMVWLFGGSLGRDRRTARSRSVRPLWLACRHGAEGATAALAAGFGIAGLAGWLPFAWRAPLIGG